MKPFSKEIEAMEGNEYGFFSLWSDVVELDSAKLFLNRNLRDDMLFNRASISETNADKDTIVEEALAHFQEAGIKPAFFISQHHKKIEQKLLEMSFKHSDDFNVMKLAKFIPYHTRSAEVSAIGEDGDESWTNTYMKSFGIASNFKGEISKRVQNSLGNGRCTLYIAKVDGEPAGTCLAYSEGKTTGFYCIGTIQKFRGIGIASQMLQTGIEGSKARSYCLQNLEGDDVRIFYEKRGFKTAFVKKVYQKA